MCGVPAGGGSRVEEEEVAEREGVAGGRKEVDAGADAGSGGGGFLAAHCCFLGGFSGCGGLGVVRLRGVVVCDAVRGLWLTGEGKVLEVGVEGCERVKR